MAEGALETGFPGQTRAVGVRSPRKASRPSFRAQAMCRGLRHRLLPQSLLISLSPASPSLPQSSHAFLFFSLVLSFLKTRTGKLKSVFRVDMNEKDTPSLEWEEWNGKLPSPELGRAGGGGGLTESEARVSVRARGCTRARCGLGPAPATAASRGAIASG